MSNSSPALNSIKNTPSTSQVQGAKKSGLKISQTSKQVLHRTAGVLFFLAAFLVPIAHYQFEIFRDDGSGIGPMAVLLAVVIYWVPLSVVMLLLYLFAGAEYKNPTLQHNFRTILDVIVFLFGIITIFGSLAYFLIEPWSI